jgi:hypothetical protein
VPGILSPALSGGIENASGNGKENEMTKRIEGNAPQLVGMLPAFPHARQYTETFDSPEQFARVVGERAASGFGWNRDYANNGAFYGTYSLADATKLCIEGWPEGAARVAALRDKINAANPTGPRIVRFDVAGAYPIVPRYVAGNPMSMKRIDTAKLRRRPVLSLVADITANCNVDARAMTNRAAVTAAIVDAIEAAGYSCHVMACGFTGNIPGGGGDLVAGAAWTVKEAGAHVDVGRMAFGIGHAAIFRRFVFCSLGFDKFTSDLRSNLGYAHSLQADGMPRDAYLLPAIDAVSQAKFKSDDTAEAIGLPWLINELQKQGCPAFPALENAA